MNSAHAPTICDLRAPGIPGVRSLVGFLSRPAVGLFVIVLAGTVVRYVNLGHSSLVFDEIWRAQRVAEYSLSPDWGLQIFSVPGLRPPILLYHVTWLTTQVFGVTEWALRLPSVFMGAACIVLIYLAGRAWLGVGPALWAAAVAAFHPVLWYYSRHAQPYAAEMLCTALILTTALHHLHKADGRSLVTHTAACVLSLGFCYSATFSILAWLPVLGWAAVRSGDEARTATRRLIVSTCIQLAAIASAIWWTASHGREFTVEQWGRVYNAWPTSATLGGIAAWLRYVVTDVMNYWIGLREAWIYSWYLVPAFLLLALVAGLAPAWRANRYGLAFVAILLGGLLVAGATRLWPFVGQRTVAFVIPVVCLLAGAGLERIRLALRSRAVTALMVFAVVGLPAARAAKRSIVSPLEEEHIRPVVEYVKQHRTSTDALFVYNGAHYAFDYYWSDAAAPVIRDPSAYTDDQSEKHALVDGVMSDHPRAWFLFTRYWKHEHEDMTDYIDTNYRITDSIEFETASAYRVEHRSGDQPNNEGAI